MNFLSHYYFHNDKNDNYFTVGLTMPDLLSFLSKRIRLTKKLLKKLNSKENNYNIKSHIAGMFIHLDLDGWFHSSDFFKKNILFLQNKYIDYNEERELFPNFYSHIVLEILIDKYLLTIQPDIADNFYASYKSFNFAEVSKLFTGFENFDKSKFLIFTNDMANSSFLKEYSDNNSFVSILTRVSRRIGIPMFLKTDHDKFALFIKSSYDELKNEIKNLIYYIKNNNLFNKDEIIKNFQ